VICSQPIELEGFSRDQWILIANRSLLRIYGRPPWIHESLLG